MPVARRDRMTNPSGVWTKDPCPNCCGGGRLRPTPGGRLLAARFVPATGWPDVPCPSCDATGREPVRVIVRGFG